MYRAAAIGDKDSILGFRAIGIDVFDVSLEDPVITLEKLAKSDYAVIFITEDIMHKLSDVMEKYSEITLPAIIPIPGNKGAKGLGMDNIRRAAEKAIGADILFKDN